jgi:hypothetical protein
MEEHMSITHKDPYKVTTPDFVLGIGITAFVLFGLPWILFIGFFSTIEIISGDLSEFPLLMFLSSTGVALTMIGWCMYSSWRTKRTLRRVVAAIKCQDFTPRDSDEGIGGWGRRYFGIDTKSGSALFVQVLHRNIFTPFHEILIMGFDINNWTKFEVEGGKFKIYTGEPDIPYISYSGAGVNMFYEKFDAMRRKRFDYPYYVPGYIEHKAIQIADKLNLELFLPRR